MNLVSYEGAVRDASPELLRWLPQIMMHQISLYRPTAPDHRIEVMEVEQGN